MTDKDAPSNHGPGWWVWFRTKVLLLPPGVPLTHSTKREEKAKRKAAAQGETSPGAETANPYLSLSPAPAPAAAPAPPAAETSPWAVEEESSLWVAVSKVLRIAAIIALLFVTIVGIRQLIAPTQSQTVVQQVEDESFPAAGSDVARRHAAAYLTVSPEEEAGDERDRLLGLDATEGEQEQLDVSGRQGFTQGAVVRIAQIDQTRARATVSGLLTDYTRKGESWSAGATRPVAVEMTLVADETGTVRVQGSPALVSTTPGPVALAAAPDAGSDSAVTTATSEAAASFFQSYGADADVTASVAPGSNITGLDGAAALDGVSRWTVHEGDENTHSATAEVRWTLPSGVSMTQTYSLTLTRVSGNETGGWQIAAITGGSN